MLNIIFLVVGTCVAAWLTDVAVQRADQRVDKRNKDKDSYRR